MTLDAITRARDVAQNVVAPAAPSHDREGTFSSEAVAALGQAGLLGLTVPTEHGGLGLGARALASTVEIIAGADASVAMVYLMHLLGTACIAAAPDRRAHARTLESIARGEHLTTLAFSEKGSRSHFWAPVSRARMDGARIWVDAQKSFVTSAGHAASYVVTTLAAQAKGPTDTTLYLVRADRPGVRVDAAWNGMGLRANASAPMTFEGVELTDDARLTEEGAGFKAKLEVVLPLFNVGSAAVALGICRAATSAAIHHLKTARFEHMGQSLGEALPTLRAQLADMQIATDSLAALLASTLDQLEAPSEQTMLRVLELKAAAGETAIHVTSLAMRACGGAAFARHTMIERHFRDAHAGAVMAPTADVLRELIGKALLGIPLF